MKKVNCSGERRTVSQSQTLVRFRLGAGVFTALRGVDVVVVAAKNG